MDQTTVGVHQAKTHLSQLLKRVAAGEEIVIVRGSEPLARLVPYAAGRREMGFAASVFQVPDDFDRPLSDRLLDDFER